MVRSLYGRNDGSVANGIGTCGNHFIQTVGIGMVMRQPLLQQIKWMIPTGCRFSTNIINLDIAAITPNAWLETLSHLFVVLKILQLVHLNYKQQII